jgi:hypothetical protein
MMIGCPQAQQRDSESHSHIILALLHASEPWANGTEEGCEGTVRGPRRAGLAAGAWQQDPMSLRHCPGRARHWHRHLRDGGSLRSKRNPAGPSRPRPGPPLWHWQWLASGRLVQRGCQCAAGTSRGGQPASGWDGPKGPSSWGRGPADSESDFHWHWQPAPQLCDSDSTVTPTPTRRSAWGERLPASQPVPAECLPSKLALAT